MRICEQCDDTSRLSTVVRLLIEPGQFMCSTLGSDETSIFAHEPSLPETVLIVSIIQAFAIENGWYLNWPNDHNGCGELISANHELDLCERDDRQQPIIRKVWFEIANTRPHANTEQSIVVPPTPFHAFNTINIAGKWYAFACIDFMTQFGLLSV